MRTGPFQLGICTGPFPVGGMDWTLSGWGYGRAPFRLGIWTGPFPVGYALGLAFSFIHFVLVVCLIHFRGFGAQSVAHFSTHWHTKGFLI